MESCCDCENNFDLNCIRELSIRELAVGHAKISNGLQKLKVRKRWFEEELCTRNECVDVTDSSTCSQLGRQPFRINVRQNRKTLPHSKITLRSALLQYLQTTNPENVNGLDAIAEQAVQFVWALRPSKQHTALNYSVLRR